MSNCLNIIRKQLIFSILESCLLITRTAPARNLFAERQLVQIGHCFWVIKNVIVVTGAINIPNFQIGATIFLFVHPIAYFLAKGKVCY